MRQEEKRNRVEQAIRSFMRKHPSPPFSGVGPLFDSSRWKRLRPMLLLELLEAFGQELTEAHFKWQGLWR